MIFPKKKFTNFKFRSQQQLLDSTMTSSTSKSSIKQKEAPIEEEKVEEIAESETVTEPEPEKTNGETEGKF